MTHAEEFRLATIRDQMRAKADAARDARSPLELAYRDAVCDLNEYLREFGNHHPAAATADGLPGKPPEHAENAAG